MPDPPFEMPVAFGVDADTGLTLPPIDPATLAALSYGELEPGALDERANPANISFALTGELDPNDLSQAGWGVIFAPDADPRIREALQPLLDRRMQQVKDDSLFKIFDGADGLAPTDDARSWLARKGVTMQVVDSRKGVPYYLLLVGSPDQIPFEVQYSLDIFWSVGRLHFPDLESYARYAESVVAYETMPHAPRSRQLAVFAPRIDGDAATQLFADRFANDLIAGSKFVDPIGKRQKFLLRSLVGHGATKSGLSRLLSDSWPGGAPALLISGSHGMAFRAADPRLVEKQGAVVCQDWAGPGSPINEAHWFSAADLDSSHSFHGMIHFFFACYSGGCPKFDTFQRLSNQPKQIAPNPMLARLPQAMLTHGGAGALASIAHIDRAWAYSLVSDRGGAQTQGFRDVLSSILRGDRVGQAMDRFNLRWAGLSCELLDSLNRKQRGNVVSDAELASRWVARDDARNYIVFGDPAVRMRQEDMSELFTA
jgi:hypothetical protein